MWRGSKIVRTGSVSGIRNGIRGQSCGICVCVCGGEGLCGFIKEFFFFSVERVFKTDGYRKVSYVVGCGGFMDF